MDIFNPSLDGFRVNMSPREAIELNPTPLEEPKSGVFNDFDHMGKPRQKYSKRVRSCNSSPT